MSLFKKALYNGIYLQKDVNELEKIIDDQHKSNSFLGKINPKFYYAIFQELIKKGLEEKVKKVSNFKKNEKVYKDFFLEDDKELILKNMDNKQVLKEIISSVPKSCVRGIYLFLLQELPKDKAKSISAYSDYIVAKSDLEFLIKMPVEKTNSKSSFEEDLLREIQALKKEVQELKSVKATPLQQEKEEKPEEKSEEKTKKEKTDDFGKELFS